MSFDMGVWYEPKPISDIAAETFYQRLCEGQSTRATARDKVDEFYRELTARYPENDDSPWAAGIDVSAQGVVMSIQWDRSKKVEPYIVELAAKHGLFAYNPQTNELHQGVGWEPRLITYDDQVTPFPTADEIARELSRLTADRWFVVLEARSHWFIQAALREEGGYTVEYREGCSERHFGTTVETKEQVHAAFVAFAAEGSWQDGSEWHRVSFQTE